MISIIFLLIPQAYSVSLRVLESTDLPPDIDLSEISDSELSKHYENIFEQYSKSFGDMRSEFQGQFEGDNIDQEAFSLLARDMLEKPLSIKPETFIQKGSPLSAEDSLFENLAVNKQSLYSSEMKEHIKTIKSEIPLTQAYENLHPDLPVDVVNLLRAEVDGTEDKMPAKVVDRALTETKGLITGVQGKVDRLTIYWCMPRDIYLREVFQSQTYEMVRLAGEFRQEVGRRQSAMDKTFEIRGARDNVLTDLAEKRRAFWTESTRLQQQIKTATDSMLVKKVLYDSTDPDYKASVFSQTGKNTLYKLCPPGKHDLHDVDVEDDERGEDEDEDSPVTGLEFVLIDEKIKSKMSTLPLEGQIHLKEALGNSQDSEFFEENLNLDEGPVPVSKGKPKKDISGNKCLSDRGGSQMKLLHDRCSKMLGKEQDKLDKLNEELASLQTNYNKDNRRFTATLNGLKRQESNERAVVSEAEATLLQVWKDYRDVANMAWRVWWWLWWTRYWCRWQLRQFVHVELCSLLKIRDNIVQRFKKEDPLTAVVDCQVTPWQGSKCSKTCAKGEKTIFRVVEVKPNVYGAYCPRLKARMLCNVHPCPIDCTVTPWSAFDACSVKCGEGTKSRSRTVTTQNKHRGKQCPGVVDTETCFMKPCDVDCELGDWSPYSGCSRACTGKMGSGRQYSVRRIKVKREGMGRKCASKYSPVRIESRVCNEMPCPKGKLKCKARQDVVLAFDSSGSLRPHGAKAMKLFLAELAGRYETAVWDRYTEYVKEMKDGKLERKPVDKWKWRRYNKVGLMSFSREAHVLTPLTYYPEKLSKGIEGFTFLGKGTQTHLAVRKAQQMFKSGRSKAQSVLVIVTDSIPDRNFLMAKDIEKAKSAGTRVIIIFFGYRRSYTLKKYVSFPPRDNFIRLWSPWAVSSWWGRRWVGNRFVRITCPRITPLPEAVKLVS